MGQRRAGFTLATVLGVAIVLPTSSPAAASPKTRRGGTTQVRTTSHRIGSAHYHHQSVSGLGAGSFLLGGPVGWGIYRGVDMALNGGHHRSAGRRSSTVALRGRSRRPATTRRR